MSNKRGAFHLSISAAAMLFTATIVSAAIQMRGAPSDNPWDYTLLTECGNISLTCTGNEFIVNGDVRSNRNINLNGSVYSFSGNLFLTGELNNEGSNLDTENLANNVDIIDVPNRFDSVYLKGTGDGNYEYINNVVAKGAWNAEHTLLSNDDIYIDVLSDVTAEDTLIDSGKGKIGIFGAGFLTNAFANYDKWQAVIPLFDSDIELSTGENGNKDLLELAKKSNFIPIQEKASGDDWDNYDRLPGSVISNNFGSDTVAAYINKLKSDSEVFSIAGDDLTVIHAMWDNSSINPSNANNTSINVRDGNVRACSVSFQSEKKVV